MLCGKFLAFMYLLSFLYKSVSDIHPKIVKNPCLHNNHLNLCRHVQFFKWILFSRKTGVKCGNYRFFNTSLLVNNIFPWIRFMKMITCSYIKTISLANLIDIHVAFQAASFPILRKTTKSNIINCLSNDKKI